MSFYHDVSSVISLIQSLDAGTLIQMWGWLIVIVTPEPQLWCRATFYQFRCEVRSRNPCFCVRICFLIIRPVCVRVQVFWCMWRWCWCCVRCSCCIAVLASVSPTSSSTSASARCSARSLSPRWKASPSPSTQVSEREAGVPVLQRKAFFLLCERQCWCSDILLLFFAFYLFPLSHMAHSQENQFNFLKTLPHHCLKDEYTVSRLIHTWTRMSPNSDFLFFSGSVFDRKISLFK